MSDGKEGFFSEIDNNPKDGRVTTGELLKSLKEGIIKNGRMDEESKKLHDECITPRTSETPNLDRAVSTFKEGTSGLVGFIGNARLGFNPTLNFSDMSHDKLCTMLDEAQHQIANLPKKQPKSREID